jgi:Superinfection immunity protein
VTSAQLRANLNQDEDDQLFARSDKARHSRPWEGEDRRTTRGYRARPAMRGRRFVSRDTVKRPKPKENFYDWIPNFCMVVLYFLPSVVAALRQHRNGNAIAVLNLFLGWTFLGWLVALIWACTYQETRPTPQPTPAKTAQPKPAEPAFDPTLIYGDTPKDYRG